MTDMIDIGRFYYRPDYLPAA